MAIDLKGGTTPKGFSLGNYWIASSGILGTFFLPFALFITLISGQAANTSFGVNSFVTGILLLTFCGLYLGSAFGLYYRKSWGLYLAYLSLILEFFLGLAVILFSLLASNEEQPSAVVQIKVSVGVILVTLAVLWWLYFSTRQDLFD